MQNSFIERPNMAGIFAQNQFEQVWAIMHLFLPTVKQLKVLDLILSMPITFSKPSYSMRSKKLSLNEMGHNQAGKPKSHSIKEEA